MFKLVHYPPKNLVLSRQSFLRQKKNTDGNIANYCYYTYGSPYYWNKINFTYICSVHYIKAAEENTGVCNYQYITYQE